MRKTSLRVAPALFGVIASVVALAAGPALSAQINKCTKITRPGSYVLTRNLTTAAGRDCLVVAADFVTIDLGGWVITGTDIDTGAGITDQGAFRQDIAVRNGTITGFANGVGLGTRAVVEKVRVDASVVGIRVGLASIVSGNIARGEALFAINAGPDSIVSGNVALNSDTAIIAGPDSIVSDNVVFTGGGGLFAGPSSTVSGNNVRSGEGGISAGRGSTVSGNTAHTESLEAFFVDCPSNVIGNTATGGLLLNGEGCTNIDNLVAARPDPSSGLGQATAGGKKG